MARLVEEVLQTWRTAERLLEELPPVHPDHETTRLHVNELRDLYRELTDTSASSRLRIHASVATLRRASAAIEAAARRLDGDLQQDADIGDDG